METRFSKVVTLAAGMALMLAVQAHGQTPVANIEVASVTAMDGQTVPVDVTLSLLVDGTQVAGTQNTITFSGGVGAVVTIGAKANGKPDCAPYAEWVSAWNTQVK